ncbi:MAG: DUF2071 domain-containing protein [Gemmataceae bacterium]|nr:DUF2071 domain-containing protein [Gemmataceae bacterium]
MGDTAPARRRAFLTARWCNLILANYAVPEELLRPRLPPGLDLDRRDGRCWASLVGFQFLDTRVLGIGWPGYRHFPEWNLRFYVREGDRRGVCFVREFVPQRLVAGLARLIYNEPYRAARMTMRIDDTPEAVTATYSVAWGGRTHSLRAAGLKPAVQPGPDSAEHFFKEHSWGYGVSRRGRPIRYEVNHPEWDVYPVRSFAADVDWGVLYGPEWAAMTTATPASVVLAAGSEVSVYPKG